MQEDSNGDLHPCSFISARFTKAEQNYQIYDHKLLAIYRGLQAWRHYLLGPKITIRCDHKNLTFFKKSQFLSPRQARWQLFLSMFDYMITHVPGAQMVQADALSRHADFMMGPEETPEILLPAEKFIETMAITISDQDLKFSHNQHVNANSRKTPFEIIMGYNPTATPTFPLASKFPALEERLRGLHDIRKEALAAHDMA